MKLQEIRVIKGENKEKFNGFLLNLPFGRGMVR